MTPLSPSALLRPLKFLKARPFLAIGLILFIGGAAAAITLTYTTTSTLTTSVTPAPVQFVAGTDAGPSALTTYVSAYAISTNKTYFSSTVKGVPESTLGVGSYVQLQNVDGSNAHTVTLTTPQVSNAYVSAYTLQLYNATNVLQATLDLKTAAPTATFTIPAASTWYGTLTLTLASGAGTNNVALTNALTLTTS